MACLGTGIDKCSQQVRERFEEYRNVFEERVTQWLADEAYTQRVRDRLHSLEEKGKLPSLKKLDKSYKQGDGKNALQEITLKCVAEVRENRMDRTLNPEFWDASCIEEKAKKMYRLKSAPARQEKWNQLAVLCVMAFLGLAGPNNIGECLLFLAALILVSPDSGRKDRALLVGYALFTISYYLMVGKEFWQIFDIRDLFVSLLIFVGPVILWFLVRWATLELEYGQRDIYPVVMTLMLPVGIWMGVDKLGYWSGLAVLAVSLCLLGRPSERWRRLFLCDCAYLIQSSAPKIVWDKFFGGQAGETMFAIETIDKNEVLFYYVPIMIFGLSLLAWIGLAAGGES